MSGAGGVSSNRRDGRGNGPGPGTDEPLVRYEGTGTSDRHWYHADERGSIIATSDGSGAVTSVNSYDEYGIPGSGNTGRFQYTGQQWLSDIGMYYYRARMYSPTFGRFLQTDPIGYAGGMNLHAYAGNDPLNFTDPTGLEQLCYTHITRGWTDRSNPDEPVVSARRESQVCFDFFLDPSIAYTGVTIDSGSHDEGGSRSECRTPLARREYPVPPGYRPSPLYPNNTFVLNSSGRLEMNPLYNEARTAAGLPAPGTAGVSDLLGPNPGSVIIDLLAIAGTALVATIFPPAAEGPALGRAATMGAAAAQGVNHSPPC